CTVPDIVLSTRAAEMPSPSTTPIVPTLSAPARRLPRPRIPLRPRLHGPHGCWQTATVLEIPLPILGFAGAGRRFVLGGNHFSTPSGWAAAGTTATP
ncbi:MAG: hypothetical protein LBV60_07590, partial [Streptomyces sp.]|nr:hypothetical protein [Streptomyces sp.]